MTQVRHVIVEGPDGGGKSTLIRKLREQFGLVDAPRASRSESGPVASLYDWYVNDLARARARSAVPSIYDRHPLISEPIYAPIARGVEPQTPFDDPDWLTTNREIMAARALLVVCLPPSWVARTNAVRSVQMPGVVDNIGALWSAYSTLADIWPRDIVWYDYTNHDAAPFKILQIGSRLRGGLRV